jgi:methylmalonyl-CoA/ethylmalonyl-CoA epimerase
MKRFVFPIGVAALAAFVSLSGRAQEASAPKLGELPIDHVGVIVKDVEKAAKAYADVLGIPASPVKEQTGVVFPADYRGDRKAHTKTVTFQLNGVGLELMQPVGGASPWRDHLDKYGEGLHHIAIAGVKNVADAAAFAASKGGKQVVGGPGYKTAFVDLKPVLGFTLELSEQPAGAPAAAAPSGGEAVQKFGENPVAYISVIVPDIEKSTAVFSELMGTPQPKIVDPKIMYPKEFTGDRAAHPRLAMVTLPGLDVAYTSPVGGASPWRENVDKQGAALHHLGIRIKGMADNIAYLEKKGGRLVIGGADLGYSWVDLPPLRTLFELNGK